MHQTSIEHLSGVIETWYLPGPRATSSKVDSHLNTMEVTFFVVHLAFCLFVLTCLQSQRSRLSSEVKWDFRWEYPPPEEFKVQVCSSVSSLHTMYKRFCHLSLPRYPEMKGARYVCFLKCSGASLSIKYSDFFFYLYGFTLQNAALLHLCFVQKTQSLCKWKSSCSRYLLKTLAFINLCSTEPVEL